MDHAIAGLVSPTAGRADTSTTPIHGQGRNWMFLDWHIAATSRTDFA